VIPLTPQPAWTLQPGKGGSEVPEELLDAIQNDLAGRLQVSEAGLTVLRAEATTWPDSSLGCAQKGTSYLQVVTPGYWIVLGYGQETYDYRADDRGYFFLCEQGLGPGLAPPANEENW
jgi:hypothetical protein